MKIQRLIKFECFSFADIFPSHADRAEEFKQREEALLRDDYRRLMEETEKAVEQGRDGFPFSQYRDAKR